MPHEITLPQNSINLLRNCLGMLGWATEIKYIHFGGQLLAETIPEADMSEILSSQEIAQLSSIERKRYLSIDKEFCERTVTITISESERDTIKACLLWCATKGTIPPGKWSHKLIGKFFDPPNDAGK